MSPGAWLHLDVLARGVRVSRRDGAEVEMSQWCYRNNQYTSRSEVFVNVVADNFGKWIDARLLRV